jgi:hypothetical protein
VGTINNSRGGRGFMLASFRVVENYEVDEVKKIKNRFSWFPLFPIQSKYDSHMRNMIPLLNFHPPFFSRNFKIKIRLWWLLMVYEISQSIIKLINLDVIMQAWRVI